MKKLRYYIIACTASLAFLTACDNAEYNVIDNAIYLEEPSLSASNNTKLTVDGEVTTTSITARLGQAVGENVTGTIEIDPAILTEYNEKHFTTYEVLPEKFLSYNKNFEIKAGETVAEATTFTIKNFPNDNGELYAVPVRMKVAEGAVSTIGESDHYIILLDKALIQSAPFMNTSNVAGTSTRLASLFPNGLLRLGYGWTVSKLIIRLLLIPEAMVLKSIFVLETLLFLTTRCRLRPWVPR